MITLVQLTDLYDNPVLINPSLVKRLRPGTTDHPEPVVDIYQVGDDNAYPFRVKGRLFEVGRRLGILDVEPVPADLAK